MNVSCLKKKTNKLIKRKLRKKRLIMLCLMMKALQILKKRTLFHNQLNQLSLMQIYRRQNFSITHSHS